jgi:hypothetical protein
MTTMQKTLTQKVTQATENEPGRPRLFSSLIERLRNGRESSRAFSLLESSLGKGGAGGGDFEDALSQYSCLGPQGKEKVLGQAAGLFDRYSSFTFDSPQKVAAMTTLSVFIAEAAAALPRDAKGAAATASRDALAGGLKALALDSTLYDHHDQAHAAAKLAAASGLWELGCMESGLWESLLAGPATRGFTIMKMLDMPVPEEFEGHGWQLLRDNLDTALAADIASSASARKADFLASMMLEPEGRVSLSALEGAIYLRPLPPEFLDMARELSARAPEFRTKASYFLSAAGALPHLESADDTQFQASMHLIRLYSEGMAHIGPLLEREVAGEMADIFREPAGAGEGEREVQRQNALMVLYQMHLRGLRTEGFKFKGG